MTRPSADDRQVLEARLGADSPGRLGPPITGMLIDQHHVEVAVIQGFDGVLAVVGLDDLAAQRRQHHADDLAIDRIVVDDQRAQQLPSLGWKLAERRQRAGRIGRSG
jgi:hypothetical protein